MPANDSSPPTLEVVTRAADQLGQALARFRAHAGLSQQKVAASSGLRQATVSKAEQGADTTQLKTVYALCAALGLELVMRPRSKARGPMRPEDFK